MNIRRTGWVCQSEEPLTLVPSMPVTSKSAGREDDPGPAQPAMTARKIARFIEDILRRRGVFRG
jgi:hypothetical protein